MIFVLCTIVIVLFLIHLIFNFNKRARLLRKIPGLRDTFILGNALQITTSPTGLFSMGRKLAEQHNGIYRFWAFPLGAINLYNPKDIEIIISTSAYNEKSDVYRFLRPWLKQGLLVSSGSKWLNRRKILTPTFHFNILRQFCVTLEENSRRLVDTLEKFDGEAIDVTPVISECTLNSISETAMGVRLRDSSAGKFYKKAIHDLGSTLVYRFTHVQYYLDFFFKLSVVGKLQSKYLQIVHKFTKNVINERKKHVEQYGITLIGKTEDTEMFMSYKKKIAMLDLLISAEKEGLIDSSGIQEEVDTFMFEGHDTTAAGLIYCFMLLANNLECQNIAVAELNDIFGESERPATMDDLTRMQYLERCIKESLRLYPPVPFISRAINKPVKLSNYEIPKGIYCHIHIYDLHRRADLFKDPTKFDPDRFLPKNSIGRHPYSYIPFSAGPRNCIGQRFAMMEMKLVVSAILRNFLLLPVTKPEDLQFIGDLVLRNSGPVYVKFVKKH